MSDDVVHNKNIILALRSTMGNTVLTSAFDLELINVS